MPDLSTRRRRDADVPALVEILVRQQPETHYPFHWPSDRAPEDFIRRPGELASWVAELHGVVVGHVAIQSVADDDELGQVWATAHGVPVAALRCVSVLFADRRLARRGIGSALLQRATDQALADGGAPVLDVVAEHREPRHLYLARGWVEVGRSRPAWLPASAEPVYLMILPRTLGG
ncbi:GNAT family N-acetyltransferase [Humibacillus sp. DSM 29435]|uniref:GNAT family N-acetyltransferase n=1 Tax=Humibacillus sp. DSM 29435 TaxID=1869167 RepID=UPI001586CA66|nr:GNAT family N-acetyltransferase [Humibacillus sp. DSM 29435]